jgi:hypothetical protein
MLVFDDAARFNESLFGHDLQNETVEMKGDIDQLFNELEEYRDSRTFQQIIEFCASFKRIAPFNAMLIHMQLPGCRYVLTSRQWRRDYHRKLKLNARPLFYLNMTPVGALYDISHTVPIDESSPTEQEILERIAHPFKCNGNFDAHILDTLLRNLPFFGIGSDLDFEASDSYAAYICKYESRGKVRFNYKNDEYLIEWPLPYFLSVNKALGDLERFQSICHELGHFFCHHLPPQTENWWEKRETDKTIREFEAEITAYLVCKRNGVEPPKSGEYLSGYVAEHAEIPRNISVEAIMNAVRDIERMLSPLEYTDGLLYKKDECFQKSIQEAKRLVDEKNKRKKKR